MDKEAARLNSNFILTHTEMRYRFAAALKREEKLMQIWENTSLKIEKQEKQIKNLREINENLNEQLAVREEETKAVQNACKKIKRKSFVNGTLLGVLVGVVGTTLILTR
jgi:peptide subunit release factor RF-3